MRKAANHTEEAGAGLLSALGWNARDVFGLAVGICAMLAILINVLFMQSGPHPAPMFNGKPVAAKPMAAEDTTVAVAAPRAPAIERAALPPAIPGTSAKAAPAPAKSTPAATSRAPGEIITDIQRELARRGFFDGAIDGLYGPKTDGAIRDFEQMAGLRPSHEPSEALLAAIQRAPAKVVKAAGNAAPVVRPAAPVRNEAERQPSSKRVIALQRVLAEFGYGQIKPTGVVDAETQTAIEKFERERRLPITGQASERVTRELAAMTGRPLE